MGSKGSSSAQNAPATSKEDFDYFNRYPDVQEAGMNPYYHYLKYGQAEGRTYGAGAPSGEGMFDALGGMMEMLMRQKEDAAVEQKRLNEEYAEKQRRATGTAQLDELFSTKLSAAQQAQAEVDKQITDEIAHASVRGLDYAVTPEQKTARINNLFGSYWSEGQESELTQYASEFGTNKHVWTLPIVRGEAAGGTGALPPEVKVGGKVQRGGSGSTVLTEDEEDKTASTILGG